MDSLRLGVSVNGYSARVDDNAVAPAQLTNQDVFY